MDCASCPLKQFTLEGKGPSIRRQEKMRSKLRFVMSHPKPSFVDKALFSSPTTSLFDRFVKVDYDMVFTKNCVQAGHLENTGKGIVQMERDARACCAPTLAEDLKGATVIVACGNEALEALGYKDRKAGNSTGWVEYNEELGASVLACLDPHVVENSPEKLANDWIWTVQRAQKIVQDLAPRENILPTVNWEAVETIEQFKKIIKRFKTDDLLAIDIETVGLNWRKDRVLVIGIYNEAYDKVLMLTPELFTKNAFKEVWAELVNRMRCTLANSKFDAKFLLYQYGLKIPVFYDTLPMHQMIDERTGIHGLKRLLQVYRNWPSYEQKIDHYYKMEGALANCPFEELAQYCAYDVYGTYMLTKQFLSLLRDDRLSRKYPWEIMLSQREYIENITRHVNMELLDVEINGFITDEVRLDKLIAEAIPSVEKHRRSIEDLLFAEVGREVSVDSPLQLLAALHEMKALPPEINTTESKVIKNYIKVPIIKMILEYKKEYKILTAFYNSIKEKLIEDHGVMKTFATFNIAGTIGSRWSGANPNLQQAPRAPHPFKSIFTASPGHVIFQNDFTSLEVCMAAYLSKDMALAAACKPGADMHQTVSESAFKKYHEEMRSLDTTEDWENFLNSYSLLTAVKKSIQEDAEKRGSSYNVAEYESAIVKHLRFCAKTITFGIFFGRGARALAEQELNCSIAEAQTFIDDYFKLFPVFYKWIRKVQYLVKDVGIIIAPDGRVRDLRFWMFSSDPMKRKQALARAYRQAVNFLTQNMSGTVNNIAFIKAAQYLRENKCGRMLGAVHDSSVGEIFLGPQTAVHMANIRELQNSCLTSDFVSFRVESELGMNWASTIDDTLYLEAVGPLVLEHGADKLGRELVEQRTSNYVKMVKVKKMTPDELAKAEIRPELAAELEQIIKEIDAKWEMKVAI